MLKTSETTETFSGSFSFVEMEHDILAYWEQAGIFQKSLEQTKGKKPYIFYDGPPFATGIWSHLPSRTLCPDTSP